MRIAVITVGIHLLMLTSATAQPAQPTPQSPEAPPASEAQQVSPPAANSPAPAPTPDPAPAPAQPDAPTPGPAPATSTPPAAAGSPAPATAPGTPEAAQPPPAGATTTHAQQAQPAGEPQPPVYQPLGGAPEQQEPEGDWDPWDHPESFGGYDHRGFFLRLSLGLGGGNVDGDVDPTGTGSVSFSGGGLAADVAVGGSVLPGLALHLDLFWAFLLGPEAQGGFYDEYPELFDGDVTLQGTGIGLTWHITPINLYLSVSGGLGSVAWERSDGARSSSRLGLGLNFLVGKEWWVDPEWGIGLAAQFLYVAADDPFYDSVGAYALNLLFSATYN